MRVLTPRPGARSEFDRQELEASPLWSDRCRLPGGFGWSSSTHAAHDSLARRSSGQIAGTRGLFRESLPNTRTLTLAQSLPSGRTGASTRSRRERPRGSTSPRPGGSRTATRRSVGSGRPVWWDISPGSRCVVGSGRQRARAGRPPRRAATRPPSRLAVRVAARVVEQAEVPEDAPDDAGIVDRRDHAHAASAVRTGEYVHRKNAMEQVGPPPARWAQGYRRWAVGGRFAADEIDAAGSGANGAVAPAGAASVSVVAATVGRANGAAAAVGARSCGRSTRCFGWP